MHNNTEVEGIKGGLDIKGTGTFKIHLEDDKGGVHLIKIPNSKYVPDLKVCLLSPHHWAQEAKDHYPVPNGTKIDTDNEALMLIWKQQRHQRTILYHPLTNTPSFCTALALHTYQAFVALYKAAEAQDHCREHVLQIPSQPHLNKEFTAEENVHADILKKPPLASEGATSNKVMIQASNLLSETENKEEKQTTRLGPLTFDVNPKVEEDKHIYLAAIDNQAKLMHWHYRLGHLAFSKLKQLALTARSLDDWPWSSLLLARDSFFGAMTKVPSSERQISNLAKVFLSADQIKLYFIQIIVNISQFCGIDKIYFFFFFSD